MLARNPLRSDLQRHYEEIVEGYNREKDRVTIENTFAALLKFVQSLDDEETRALREGLDEESLALFDLLLKPGLDKTDIRRIKKVAADLLTTLKAEKLRIENWRDKEATRDAVQVAIRDFLWAETTGLPAPAYSDEDVEAKVRDVYRHVHRVYPTIPSPFYVN
jgi:type I restriction enzyme R subunit